MARRRYPDKFPRLTMKKAKMLAIQELGTAKGLEAEPCAPDDYYHMKLGNLRIRIHNDYIDKSGCIILSIGMNGGYGSCVQLHDPDTLQEDFEEEERRRYEERTEELNDWVNTNGPDLCHKQIDRIWNKQ